MIINNPRPEPKRAPSAADEGLVDWLKGLLIFKMMIATPGFLLLAGLHHPLEAVALAYAVIGAAGFMFTLRQRRNPGEMTPSLMLWFALLGVQMCCGAWMGAFFISNGNGGNISEPVFGIFLGSTALRQILWHLSIKPTRRREHNRNRL